MPFRVFSFKRGFKRAIVKGDLKTQVAKEVFMNPLDHVAQQLNTQTSVW